MRSPKWQGLESRAGALGGPGWAWAMGFLEQNVGTEDRPNRAAEVAILGSFLFWDHLLSPDYLVCVWGVVVLHSIKAPGVKGVI